MRRVYICLVSDQPIPNMIPAFMDSYRPNKIILIKTVDKSIQSKRLCEIFSKYGIDVSEELTEPMDYKNTSEVIERIKAVYKDDELILNITGGTKMMSIGAFEAFVRDRNNNQKIIYVDTFNRVVKEIFPISRNIDFNNSITIEDYLISYGYKIKSFSDPNFYDYRLPNDLNNCTVELVEFSSYLGRLINESVKSSLHIKVPRDIMKSQSFIKVLKLFERYSFVDVCDNDVNFVKTENFRFITGGWLEFYVYNKIKRLLNNENNLRLGAIICKDEIENEIDIIFTYMNQLYLVECKSGKWDKNIYKMDSLIRNTGGSFGKGMLVVLDEITSNMKRRIRNSDIVLVDRNNIKNLSEIIKNWIK